MGNPVTSVQIVGSDPKARETVQLNKDGKLKVLVPVETTTSLSDRGVRYQVSSNGTAPVDIASGVSSFELVTKDNKLALNYVKGGRKFTIHNGELVKVLRKGVSKASGFCYVSVR